LNNLLKLLNDIKFKDQIFADANATLAQAFLNLEEKDSAVAKLKVATEFTKINEEKARYRFILGQLYEAQNQKDSAYIAYQSVIDMKRKSPRQYVIQAHARQSLQFDMKTGDTIAFMKKYTKLLKDRENRPYLGSLNHQLALFYDKNKQDEKAVKYYNASLKSTADDTYLTASNYRNLADINFDNAKYVAAGKYYDSTLVQLNPRSREHKLIKKKRENLVDVIKYEGIAQVNDSILNVVSMSEAQRISYYEEYIARLKKEDEIRKAREEKEMQENENARRASGELDGEDGETDVVGKDSRSKLALDNRATGQTGSPAQSATQAAGKQSDFYFYNPTTVAYGMKEFRKNWGDRELRNNWRIGASRSGNATTEAEESEEDPDLASATKNATPDERYSVDYYIKGIPSDQKLIDSLAKDRNFAYYQLGVIYKEKFREHKRAADKLEKLLTNNPEERLILPSMYNLYKIYEIIDNDKALAMKERIISQYPDSRYAQIISNSGSESVASLSPETAYNNLFKRYESGDYKNVLAESDAAIEQFTGDEIVSKFELLKASTIGKLRGLEEYKKALNFVALNYPNSPEGKDAEAMLGKNVPALENLKFSQSETTNWKILYRAKDPEEKNTKILLGKIKKFIADRELAKITSSFDIYTEADNFVVIHGMKSEEYAKGIASILKEFKEYKVNDMPIIISGQNYEIVQMKKNIDAYLANPVLVDISVTDQLPFTAPVKEVVTPPQQRKSLNQISTEKAASEKPAQPAGQKPVQGQKSAEPNKPEIGGPPPAPQTQTTQKR
jgi:hypothetical protein